MPVIDRVKGVVADLSGYDVSAVSDDAGFLDMGFDSLFLTQLCQVVQGEFGVKVTFRQLMDDLTSPQRLANFIVSQRPELAAAAEPKDTSTAGPSAEMDTEGDPAAALADMQALLQETGSDEASASGMEGIFLRQLELMRQQLEMLTGSAARQRAPAPVAKSDIASAAAKASEPEKQQPAAEDTAPAAAPAAAPQPPPGPSHMDGAAMTPHQHKHLRTLVDRWARMTPRSKEQTQHYRAVHADPRTASGFNPLWKESVYPLVVERSSGPHLWDMDGNRYVDLLCGFGPTFFGHAPRFITEAVSEQLSRGFEVGPQTPLAGETAELICEMTGMERASFVCTGSEAVQAAMRAARTYTGRSRIVTFRQDYHGNFDEVLIRPANRGRQLKTLPSAPGIPFRAVDDMVVLDYGEDESLEILRELGETVAAVLVEPVQSRRPDLQPREFLQAVRQITRDQGSVLIFDEVVTGFRSHPGGAQAVFDVEADLATYGKVVAGGLPIGVVAGRSPVIDVFDGGQWRYGDDSRPTAGVTFFAGTFVRHPLAIAAAHAALTYMKEAGPELQRNLNQRATAFVDRLNALFRERQAPIEVPHFGSQFYLRATGGSDLNSLFFLMLRSRGVYLLEGFPSYLSLAHEEEHLQFAFDAFAESVDEMFSAHFWHPGEDFSRNRTGEAATEASAPAVPADEPPEPGARLGRNRDGKPAWFVRDPEQPNGYREVG